MQSNQDLRGNRGESNVFKYTLLFVLSLFVINESVRSMISIRLETNYVFFLGAFGLLLISFFRKKVNPNILILVTFFSCFLLLTFLSVDSSLTYITKGIISIIIPLYLLCIKINHEKAILSLRVFNIIFNYWIFILLIIGVIDYATNKSIQLFLADTVFKNTLHDYIYIENLSGIYRYYSIAGHPLQGARYFLTFFLMNNIYAKYNKPILNGYMISIITMLGLILCGSKTAIVVGVVFVLFFNNNIKRKPIYFGFIILAIVVFLSSTLVTENLGKRFSDNDLSSGRNELLSIFIHNINNNNLLKPSFFLGGGFGYSRQVVSYLHSGIYNFEYPAIMFAYDYGLIATLLIYFLILIYPIYIFLKKKQYYILFIFIGLTLFINTNNAITNLGQDALAQFCYIIFIIINLNPHGQEKKGRT